MSAKLQLKIARGGQHNLYSDSQILAQFMYTPPFYDDFYNPNNIKKDTISPNNAIASQSANPKIAYTNSCFCK